jgi:NitT/TauT family transport system permease protein
MEKMKSKYHYLFGSLGFITIILVWLLFSTLQNNDVILPSIGVTFNAFINLFKDGATYLILLNTLGGLLLVLIIAFFSALILALISLKWSPFKSFLTPLLALFKIVPVPALIILFLANLKQAFIPYLLTYLVVLPLMYDGLYGAFISVNKDIIDDLKLISKLNMKMIFKVYLPLVSKGVISTLLQALGLGLKIKVMTEFISEAPSTIGYALSYARATLSMDIVFAWTLILIIIVIFFDYFLVNLLKKSG